MKTGLLIHPEELTGKWIDKMADAGVNVLGLHPVGGEGAAESLERLLSSLQKESFRRLLDYAGEKGLEIDYEFHSASFLLKRSEFERHPEYFRQDEKGNRTPVGNFCVSNPEALDTVAKNAAEVAKKLYRNSSRFYFWLDDSADSFCHCPACRNYSPSDRQLLALNRMLEEIRKEIPQAKLAYLAYCATVVPPEKIRPDEGIFLEYAPFVKYTAKGDESRKEQIAQEEKMILPLLDFFGGKDAKVLEYWFDNSLFSGWRKPPKRFTLDEEQMKNDIRQYCKKGFETLSSFACYLGEDYEALYGEADISTFPKAAKEE